MSGELRLLIGTEDGLVVLTSPDGGGQWGKAIM